jgi:hypothetical protein
MSERNRKAIISEDGGTLEVYDGGKRFIIALGFCVWDLVEIQRNGQNLPKRRDEIHEPPKIESNPAH